MKRALLASATLVLLATPVAAEPYRSFTDAATRSTTGETLIRAFPSRSPSFRLLLGPGCIVWLEFLHPDDTDHFGRHGVPDEPTETHGFTNRRELVEAPLSGADVFDEHGELGATSYIDSSIADLEWVVQGGKPFTQDALEILSVYVDALPNGGCVAGVRSLFTPNLAYRDVVDSRRLTEPGEARLRGFPADDPTFTLFVEFLAPGTQMSSGGGREITLTENLCALTLELNEAAAPFWAPALSAFEDSRDDDTRRFYILAQGGPEADTLAITQAGSPSMPWMSLATEEAFTIKDARIDTGQGIPELENTCFAEARTQFAPSIDRFYR
jgi:hypothetical protein